MNVGIAVFSVSLSLIWTNSNIHRKISIVQKHKSPCVSHMILDKSGYSCRTYIARLSLRARSIGRTGMEEIYKARQHGQGVIHSSVSTPGSQVLSIGHRDTNLYIMDEGVIQSIWHVLYRFCFSNIRYRVWFIFLVQLPTTLWQTRNERLIWWGFIAQGVHSLGRCHWQCK